MDINWINAAANLSAVGILGYWLIYGLPTMIRDSEKMHADLVKTILENQIDERQSSRDRYHRMADAVQQLAASVPLTCKYGQGGKSAL